MTHLSRTTHGIAYDATHDEIVAPNPLAAAIVIFRGGATGEAKPLRTIQGPKTKLLQVVGIAVDPRRDALVVSSYSRLPGGVTGLLIFGRTDQGDVAPRRVIAGPHSGITRLRQIALDPETGRIYAAVINNEYLPPYDIDRPRRGLDPDADLPSPWNTGTEGFIGVWDDEKDDGDVPPRSIVKGRSTGLVHPAGVTFNARDGEVIAPDAVWNGLFTFLKPELFAHDASGSR